MANRSLVPRTIGICVSGIGFCRRRFECQSSASHYTLALEEAGDTAPNSNPRETSDHSGSDVRRTGSTRFDFAAVTAEIEAERVRLRERYTTELAEIAAQQEAVRREREELRQMEEAMNLGRRLDMEEMRARNGNADGNGGDGRGGFYDALLTGYMEPFGGIGRAGLERYEAAAAWRPNLGRAFGVFGEFLRDIGGGGVGAQVQQSVEDAWKGINFTGRKDPPKAGFTFDFDKQANEAGASPTEIIRLDLGDSPLIEERKRLGFGDQVSDGDGATHLVCARCHAPLRVSQGMRDANDRVQALKCGHLIDHRCYEELIKPLPTGLAINGSGFVLQPIDDLEDNEPLRVLDEPSTNTRQTRRSTRNQPIIPAVLEGKKRKRGQPPVKNTRMKMEERLFKWNCPIGEKCGRSYTSHEIGGVWIPDNDAAIQLFV